MSVDELRMRASELGLDFEIEEEDTSTRSSKWFGGGKSESSSPGITKRAEDLGIGIAVELEDVAAKREEEQRRQEEAEKNQSQLIPEDWRIRREAAEEITRQPVLQVSVNGVQGGADLAEGHGAARGQLWLL